jgi:hypothetical protein
MDATMPDPEIITTEEKLQLVLGTIQGHALSGRLAKSSLDSMAATIRALWSDVRHLKSFVPPWAKDAPDGLDPTMYGTGTAAGDREVKARTDEAMERTPDA